MKLSTAYYTSKGSRDENEDSLCITESESGCTAIVADGLGGHSNGKRASQLAAEVIPDELGSDNITPETLKTAFARANEAIVSEKGMARMCTTAAVLVIRGRKAYAAHVGDSRIYRFRDGNILYQSKDHSVSQMAVDMGDITPDKIRGHEDRNRLLRALGDSGSSDPTVAEFDLCEGDAFLLCSDGFWEYITEPEMLECLGKACGDDVCEDWLNRMRVCVTERGVNNNSDNNTAIAIMYR